MSLRSFSVFVILIVILGSYLLKYYPDQMFEYMLTAFLAALFGQLILFFYHLRNKPQQKEASLPENHSEGEFDNDFSKVPAGTVDTNDPTPKPRRPWGIDDNYLNEDLGSLTKTPENKDKKPKL